MKTHAAPLWGAVLAGGRSRRMGLPKEDIRLAGRPQLRRAVDALRDTFCAGSGEALSSAHARVVVAARADQREAFEDQGYQVVTDYVPNGGPGSALAALHHAAPRVAWLVTAVDLALMGASELRTLAAARDPSAAATAFAVGNSQPEPLCAIWEPAGRPDSAALFDSPRDRAPGPRAFLQTRVVRTVVPADPRKLWDFDTPTDLVRVMEVFNA